MIKALHRHPDRGCWISDDRLNAFVSAPAGGITEVGFHGLQPVSRNSRLLVYPEGVLKVSLRSEKEVPFSFAAVEWSAHRVQTSAGEGGKTCQLAITAAGRSLVLTITAPPDFSPVVVVRFSLRSLFTAVHGERTWSEPALIDHRLHLSCRDRIVLKDWLRRTGPYAGDFLIPESWRRRIFSRRCRSGLATLDDVRPEYRDADIAIYDAMTFLRVGGEYFTAVQEGDAVVFSAVMPGGRGNSVECTLEFAENLALFDTPSMISPGTKSPQDNATGVHADPVVTFPGHGSLEEFFSTVPAIVRSCTVREIGMTRATPGSYYWIWAWDNLVTAVEMPRWGETSTPGRIVRFVNSHRDTDGAIPARWTRNLEPLDTPPAGALEFLLLLVAVNTALETGDDDGIHHVYRYASRFLKESAARADARALVPNIGFYPDLPIAFGRSEQSAVAMETGALYAFCRLMEVAARRTGDLDTETGAANLASRIAASYARTFWDAEIGFIRDSVDLSTGEANDAFPLFTCLFLQTPLALPLLRPLLGPMARFARTRFQSENGTRLLPAGDARRRNEDALSSWYPHWDIYLLKLFRRAGDRDGIVTWLRSMERVLQQLGYAPEFLALDGLSTGDDSAWRRHGSVSNLNCATGWYRAIIEGLFGLEFDPGGMTIIPLGLPLGPLALNGFVHRGSRWDLRVENGGPSLAGIRIDGKRINGCTKIPSRYHDGNPHRIEILYGEETHAPLLTELVNAEVCETDGDDGGATVAIRAHGTVDVAFPCSEDLALHLDGAKVSHSLDADTGTGYAQLPLAGMHRISLLKTG